MADAAASVVRSVRRDRYLQRDNTKWLTQSRVLCANLRVLYDMIDMLSVMIRENFGPGRTEP